MEREYSGNEISELHSYIRTILLDELFALGLLQSPFRLGKVESVISQNKLKVFIDGSDTAVTVSCDPDKTFVAGDEVWVEITSRDNKSKFVRTKRF